MSITVTGRKMPVTDALREYAEEKIGNSMKVMDIDPLVAEIVLFVEKNPANPRPAVCEVTLRTKGHIIRVEEHEEDMYAAIDVAAAKGRPPAAQVQDEGGRPQAARRRRDHPHRAFRRRRAGR